MFFLSAPGLGEVAPAAFAPLRKVGQLYLSRDWPEARRAAVREVLPRTRVNFFW